MTLIGVVEAANAVAEADAAVQLHDRRLSGGLGIAVGDAGNRRLLQAQDVAHVRKAGNFIKQTFLAAAGIAEHVHDAVSAKLLKKLLMPVRRHAASALTVLAPQSHPSPR